jgi:hypothetical protein
VETTGAARARRGPRRGNGRVAMAACAALPLLAACSGGGGERATLCEVATDLATTAAGRDVEDPEVVAGLRTLLDAAEADLREFGGASLTDLEEEGVDLALSWDVAESTNAVLVALGDDSGRWPPPHSATSLPGMAINWDSEAGGPLPTSPEQAEPPRPEGVEEALLPLTFLSQEVSQSCRLGLDLVPEIFQEEDEPLFPSD